MKKFLFLSLVLVFLLAITVSSAEFRSGDNILINPEEVIVDNIYLSGGTVQIRGIVNGDIVAMGGNIQLDNTIRDNLIAAGGQIQVNGNIGGSARLAGGQININSQIGKELLIAGGSISLRERTVINNDLIAYGGQVDARGTVNGNTQISAGTVRLDGTFGKDVTLVSDDIYISPDTIINGNLNYTSRKALTIPEGQVMGLVTHNVARPKPSEIIGSVVGKFISFLGSLIIGLILIALVPLFFTDSAIRLRRSFWSSLGIGALFLLFVPIALVILFVTIIGIPLALIGLAFYFIILYLAKLVAAYWLGDLIYKGRNRYVKLIIGLVIIFILSLIPFIGGLVWLVATLAGIGAAFLALRVNKERRETKRRR